MKLASGCFRKMAIALIVIIVIIVIAVIALMIPKEGRKEMQATRTAAPAWKQSPAPRVSAPSRPQVAAPTANPAAVSAPVSIRNCTHARELGVAPVRRGDPGYSRKLDRDGDGIACE